MTYRNSKPDIVKSYKGYDVKIWKSDSDYYYVEFWEGDNYRANELLKSVSDDKLNEVIDDLNFKFF